MKTVVLEPSWFDLLTDPRGPASVVEYRSTTECIFEHEHIYEWCRAAMASDYPILQHAGPVIAQPCVIVGASPELEEFLPEIVRLKNDGAHICAIKGAHDYLLEKGIVPDSAVAADPRRDKASIFARFHFQRKQQNITYFLASQMDPATWDIMRGLRVVIWHPYINERQANLPEWKGVRRVYGGNTTGLRAICLQWILGYRIFHLFGMGSYVLRDRMRVTGESCYDFDPPFPVCWAGRWWLQTTSLIQQTRDLLTTLRLCPGIRVEAHGDGPLPHVLRCGKEAGWPV